MIENASRWWSKDIESADRWRYALDYVRALERAQTSMNERTMKYAWLYDRNARLMGAGGRLRTQSDGDPPTENIIRNNIETATALLGNEATRAAALTDGAEWSVQRRAKRLERFLEAQFKCLGWDPLQVRMVRSSGVNGNGYIKLYIEDDAICAAHVPFDEVIVDDEACRAGPPTQMAQRRFVDKDVLKSHFPDFEAEIDAAHKADPSWTPGRSLLPTQIAVVETWRKPSRRKAKDGRRTVSIEGATLVDESWDYDWFPFIVFRWVERLSGYYGCGLAEELISYQRAVNKTNMNIAKSHDLFGNQRMFIHKSDALMKIKIDDDIGTLIPYSLKPPIVPDWQAVKPEVYRFKEQLKVDAEKYSGIPDMAARSMKPVGLDSGAALREWTDIQASRLATQKADLERCKLEASGIIIALAKELYGRKQNVSAFWHSRNLAKKIKWSEVDMEEDMYVLRIEPASMMSRTPAGLRQAVIDLAQTGALTPDLVLRLSGIPDIQRPLDLLTAAAEDIEAEIEELYDGKWSSPEPFMDLTNGIPRMQSALLLARRAGAPPEVLQLLMNWMVKAKALLQPAQGPQQVQQVAAPWQAGLATAAGQPGQAPGLPGPQAAPASGPASAAA